MAALGFQDAFLEVIGGGSLSLSNGRGGLERDSEVDRRTVRNASLDTAGVVALGGQALFGGGAVAGTALNLRSDEWVVVDGSRNLTAAEARADFEALGRGDAEHGVGQLGLEFVKAWLAEPDRDVSDHASHGSANAVVVIPEFLDCLRHPRGGFLARATGGSK